MKQEDRHLLHNGKHVEEKNHLNTFYLALKIPIYETIFYHAEATLSNTACQAAS